MKPKTPNNQDTGQGPKWIDKQEILLRLFISDSTLKKWRKENLLPYSRVGKKIFYRESDVHALLESNMKNLKK